jgi:glycosyltransferase involved in cell wall biosynthesis
MRILVTADTVGGVWTYTRELVTGLTLRGIQVTLVSFGCMPAAGQTHWMKGLCGLDYRPTAFKLEWMQESEADLIASSKYLEAVIEETHPNLLHLNQFYYGALECGLPRILVAHSDVVSWWVAVHQQEPPESEWIRWYKTVVRRGIAAATAVVAPSQWMLDQISRYGAKPAASRVIYNGRTPALFDSQGIKQNLVVTIGRQWDQGKNAALLLRRQIPAPVCIVGSERHPEFPRDAWAGRRLHPGVRFEGEQNEFQLGRLLARASVYAATSCYEPFGLAPVEAALSRCAIVASDIPSFRELWDGAAFFFRNNDAESLGEALEQLVKQDGLRRRYGNRALHRAQQEFSARRMVDDYISLYRGIGVAKTPAA